MRHALLLQVLLVISSTLVPNPRLAIAQTGTSTVVVSWPLPALGFVLQTNANLSTTNWQSLGVIPSQNETHKVITVNPAAENLFYRLKR